MSRPNRTKLPVELASTSRMSENLGERGEREVFALLRVLEIIYMDSMRERGRKRAHQMKHK